MTSTKKTYEPILNIPPMIEVLLIINLIAFLISRQISENIFLKFTFIPARYHYLADLDWTAVAALFTHQFLHAGFAHLLMNMAALLAFGSGIERWIGGWRTLLVYIISGIGAVAVHSFFYWNSTVPMLGASGAISGMFGFIVYRMGNRLQSIIGVVLIWLLFNFLTGSLGFMGNGDAIAWEAHMGGFIVGIVFAVVLKLVKKV